MRTNHGGYQTGPDDILDPKEYAMSIEPASAPQSDCSRVRTIKDLRRYIEKVKAPDNKLFFYPACGFDWEPLYRFAGSAGHSVCQAFIYCDYAVNSGTFEESLCGTGEHRNNLSLEEFIAISDRDLMPLLPAPNAPDEQPRVAQPVEPWGRILHLRTNNGARICLLYLALEGVRLYEKLFVKGQNAPEYLCIKQEGVGFGYGWTNFRDWNADMGTAVKKGRTKPRFVVVNCGVGAAYNWPWNVTWETFPTWHGDFGGPVFVYHQQSDSPLDWREHLFKG